MKLGDYTIERTLAVGGTAEILLAHRHGDAGEKVAIKKILNRLVGQSELVESFLGEATLVAELDHPNIVKIFDVERDVKAPYIVMELVDGCDLAILLDKLAPAPMPLPVALRIFFDVCDALAYAHRATNQQGQPLGIVHRDVDPRNVLLSLSGQAKLGDFGIAKATAVTRVRTRTGDVKGTLTYLSPEQLQSLPVDNRADVFAGGVLLYEMLTGTHPFAGETQIESMQNILDANPAPCRSLRPEIPEAVEDVIAGALAFDPEDRFSTFEEFKEALQQAVSSVPSANAKTVARYLSVANTAKQSTKREYSWPWFAAAGLLAVIGATYWFQHAPLPPPALIVPVIAEKPVPETLPLPASPPPIVPAPRAAVPSKAKVATAPAPVGTGRLRLVVRPWAQVRVDHHAVGTTPLPPMPLSAGVHVVELSNPELHRTVEREVSIESSGETVLHENLLSP